MQHKTPIIQASNLFWKAAQKTILKDLSFSIYSGQFVGIIGPNGAGKSSLLKCIYRRHPLSEGSLLINGQSIASISRQQLAQKIAVVLQEPSIDFDLTVYDYIAMGLTPRKSLLAFNDHDDEQAIIDSAELVDLSHHLHQPFKSLSGGEKQRALIARAILQKAELLLLDEPTNHLDIQHQVDVLALARKTGNTVVVTLHDLNLAATFCDYLILMNHGHIVAQGTVEQVLTVANLKQVFNVDALIDQHPFTQQLRITFDLGAQVEAGPLAQSEKSCPVKSLPLRVVKG